MKNPTVEGHEQNYFLFRDRFINADSSFIIWRQDLEGTVNVASKQTFTPSVTHEKMRFYRQVSISLLYFKLAPVDYFKLCFKTFRTFKNEEKRNHFYCNPCTMYSQMYTHICNKDTPFPIRCWTHFFLRLLNTEKPLRLLCIGVIHLDKRLNLSMN